MAIEQNINQSQPGPVMPPAQPQPPVMPSMPPKPPVMPPVSPPVPPQVPQAPQGGAKTPWALIIVLLAVLAAALVWWMYGSNMSQMPKLQDMATDTSGSTASSTVPAPLASAVYACDKGKNLSVTYFADFALVSVDGGPQMELKHLLSADGARYGTLDESFVFWNKGNTALVMRNNTMDLNYTNCTAK